MANKLHIYMNNPTSRMKDGTEASTDTETSPIAVLLDAAKEEEKAVKCAVRCDSGYKGEGAVTIKFVGANAAKWKAAQDNNYTADTVLASADWKDMISLQNVGEGNVIFWVKATSTSDESPKNDTTVDVQAEGLIVEV
ncbi:MAG: hypothetical protein ACFNJL_00305 [Selenomonas sp.]